MYTYIPQYTLKEERQVNFIECLYMIKESE